MSDISDTFPRDLRTTLPLRFAKSTRATLGCLQLPTDLTLDREGPALISRLSGVRLRLQKVDLDGDGVDLDTYETGRGRIARAAACLRPHDSLDAIGLACTSLSFALGPAMVQAEMKRVHPGAEVTDMASALLAALQQLGARRIALLTPYVPSLHQLNLRLLADAGYEVVAHANLALGTDAEITAVTSSSVRDCAIAVDDPAADTFVLSCSAFRACEPGFLDALEQRLGKPVVSSQQAFLWHLLRVGGVTDVIGGYGRLLAGQGPVVAESIGRATTGGRRSGAGEDPPDVYPSRVPAPTCVARVDPVIAADARASGPLSAAQLDRYERDGHLVLRQVFEPDEVATLKRSLEALCGYYESLSYEELDRGTDMRVISERGGSLVDEAGDAPALKSIWQIHLPAEHAPHMRGAAPLCWRVARDARLVDVAQQIVGDGVYIHQSRVNFQRGFGPNCRGGTGFLWHQDFEQWHAEDGMPRMRAVSMAILLERAVSANGALMVMPGSHRAMIQARVNAGTDDRYASGALSRGPSLPEELLAATADRCGIAYCQGEPGDVVLFDCNLVHGSHTNISPWGRMMLFAVYNAVSNAPARRPYAAGVPRPEHIGSRDPRWAGVSLPALRQTLRDPISDLG